MQIYMVMIYVKKVVKMKIKKCIFNLINRPESIGLMSGVGFIACLIICTVVYCANQRRV